MMTYFKLKFAAIVVLIVVYATTADFKTLGNDSADIGNDFSNNKSIHRSSEEFPFIIFTDEQRRHGAIIINILMSLYGFIFITFVCQDYFLPSLLCICLNLGISPDVAGATFMAMASCMSELVISIIGTFVTKSDIAIGTMVGGGVYNTLAVPACIALTTSRPKTMDKWPLFRDSIVYVMSVALLAMIAIDNMVVWYEAIIMVIMYLGYLLFLFKQKNLTKAAVNLKNTTLFHPSSNCLANIWWLFCIPVTFTLSMTIPDCKIKEERYPYTFIVSIIWISSIAYILSWMLTICGDTFQISDNIMGIVVLAAGSSVPEVVMGVINKQDGSMSISNALGSNTMSILMCLGLPWFVKTCLLPTSMNGGPVLMADEDNEFFNCMCMIISVVILDTAAIVSSFVMYRSFGAICLVGQVIVMAVLIISSLQTI